ncbi:MAG: LD-carboxypeptidase [Candidatus Bathyarchaeota archaeon]|nr:LD-carboxypeptidase [Candidatus Bathyarchaeota archaeon]
MELVKPRRLRVGDTIRVVAPASSMDILDRNVVNRGVENLQKLGFKVEVSPHASRRRGHASGTTEERAEDFMGAFTDKNVDGIVAVWGGWNSNDIIDQLDYAAIRRNPKVFIGYSDITVLNVALLEKAGLVNFQGPALVTWAHAHLMEWEVNDFKEATMSTVTPRTLEAAPTYIDDPLYYLHPEKPPQETANPGWKTYHGGEAGGMLVGGHLGTLLALAGTDYWPELRGRILFVEEDEEGGPTGRIAREFRQLEQAGAFGEINGLMVGRIPSVAGLKEGDSLEMILDDCLTGYDFPVVTGVDLGHTNPIATIPVGVKAILDAGERRLVYLDAGVND